MTRREYLEKLSRYLKKLPKEDYQEAMEYFEEYFDEAGLENEAQVMAELGSPKEAAQDIIQNILDKHLIDDGKYSRTKRKLVWIILAAILVSPFAFPLLLVMFGLLLAFFFATMAVLVTLLLAAGAIFWEIWPLWSQSLPATGFGLGLGLLLLALLFLGLWLLVLALQGLVQVLLWLVRRWRK